MRPPRDLIAQPKPPPLFLSSIPILAGNQNWNEEMLGWIYALRLRQRLGSQKRNLDWVGHR